MKMRRENFESGAPWEGRVGYSRVVRVGSQVYVAGTTATGPDGRVVGRDDPYAQARLALRNVESALVRAGAELRHVVRTRMFVTDIDRWQEMGRAHAEAFGEFRPVATMVEVARLVDPEMMVEVEADAVIHDRPREVRRPVRRGDARSTSSRSSRRSRPKGRARRR